MNRPAKLIWGTAALVAVVITCLIARFARDTELAREATHLTEKKRSLTETELVKVKELLMTPSAPAGNPPLATTESAPPTIPTETEVLQERDGRRRSILRAWSAHAYEPFFRVATLDPKQIEAFQNAVASHWQRWADVVDAAQEQGIGASDKGAWKELYKNEWTQFTSEERDALGQTAFQQLQQFERQAPMKSVADVVAGSMFDTGEPLTADRAATLVDMLANNSARFKKGGQASLDDLDKPAAFDQLRGVLTSRQLAALETSLAARDAIRKLTLSLDVAAKNTPH